MTHPVDSTDPGCRSGVARVMRWAFLTVAVFGVIAPSGLLVWQAVTLNAVLRSAPVGRFVAARASTAFISPTLTTVDTTRGSLIVRGSFSAPHGQPLEVVGRSRTPGIELCAVGHLDTCLPLAGAWAGALRPTSAAVHAIDFPRYGLATDHLAPWPFFGGALTFFCGIGWLYAHLQRTYNTPDPTEPPAITGPSP